LDPRSLAVPLSTNLERVRSRMIRNPLVAKLQLRK
jgi:hypothetical protein